MEIMNIQFTISDEIGKEITALPSTLGMKDMREVTVHAWNVLRYLLKAIRNDRCPLSPETIHWISQPTKESPSTEHEQELSYTEIDTRILQEIHRLLDDDQLDQALKATQILQLLKSHTIQESNTQLVKSEMLLTAAETFAAECDPEKAAQLIIDVTHETSEKTTNGSKDNRS